jgi:hypothetical protein
MTKQEFGIFASALRTFYPKEQILPNQQAMELWYSQLKDIPYEVAETSLNAHVATNKWSPSIAEIREMASTVQNGAIPDWGDGWEQVIMAIRKYGMYQIPEAMESFDPITRQCVERLGFRNICMSENIATDRANFRMIYEQLQERKKKDSQMSLPLKNLIQGIQQKQQILLEEKQNENKTEF